MFNRLDRMDLLIIKKKKDVECNNDIAKIFRKYNVVEYKSPDDGLTIDDFYKTIAYACLYKASAHAVNEIPAEELTISVFREGYPRELIKEITETGILIEQTAPGVYVMKDMKPFPAQIVVTGELDYEKHAGLKILSKDAKEEDIISFLNQAKEETSKDELMNIDAILQVSVFANKKIYDDIKRRNLDMCDALRDLMREEIEAEKIKGILQGRTEGLATGRKEEKYANARALLKNGLSPEVISSALNIPLSELGRMVSELIQ